MADQEADPSAESDRSEEIEFFTIYAKNYAAPEVVWLTRVIGNYRRAPLAIPTCGCRSQEEHDDHLQDEMSL